MNIFKKGFLSKIVPVAGFILKDDKSFSKFAVSKQKWKWILLLPGLIP